MLTHTEILHACDSEHLITEMDQVLDGMTNESLIFTRPFEPHYAELKPAFDAVAEQMLPPAGTMPDVDLNALRSRLESILWFSLAPVHQNLFEGRETDAFGLSGTLQRSLHNFTEQGFFDLAERIIDLVTPVRMCEGNFEIEAVIQPITTAWVDDLAETGVVQEINEAFEDKSRHLITAVLTIAEPHLIKAITEAITLPR